VTSVSRHPAAAG